jgi:uncharacterized protein (DUF2147 family)
MAKIEAIEGLGNAQAEVLKTKAEIRNTDDLLKKRARPAGREEVEAITGSPMLGCWNG